MSKDKKNIIRLIIRDHELIRDKDGNILSVINNFRTYDVEVKDEFAKYQIGKGDKIKSEIVSAEVL